MEDLERLARDLHEWPENALAAVELLKGTGFYLRDGFVLNPVTELSVTKYEWQAKRDELSGKPKEWVSNWSMWRAQDADGKWWIYEEKPTHDSARWYVIGRRCYVSCGELLGDWRDTLEKRVVEEMKQQFTVESNGDMTYHGDKPIHVGVGVIFNPGDTLVRVEVEDKSELCGANESLVNLDKSPEWIEWEGGECPVDGDIEVVVKLRDGREDILKAVNLRWDHFSVKPYDIIAYRSNYPGFLVNPMNDGGIADHELDESVDRGIAAIKTLEGIGYTDNGGELWKPPIGKIPEHMKEWDGEGLPPVGIQIEYCPDYSTPATPAGRWYGAIVVAYHGEHIWLSDNGVRLVSNLKFRPIKTPKERAIEKIYNILTTAMGFDLAAEELYRKGCRIQESDDE